MKNKNIEQILTRIKINHKHISIWKELFDGYFKHNVEFFKKE